MYCIIVLLRPNSGKMDLKREGSKKDGVWKDGQTLVSQISARKQTLRTHPFYCSLRNKGQRLVKTLTSVSYERCDRRSEFRVREIPLTQEWTTCELVRARF